MIALRKIKMSEVCEITSSKRIYANEYVDSGVPFFRGKEIVSKFHGLDAEDDRLYISENRFFEIKNKFGAPQNGDLLLTSVGTIGIPYRVDGKFEFYFKDGNLTWFRHLVGVDQSFLYYWLISPEGKAQLSKCTIGVAQPAYTIERLKEIEILLPPEIVQRKIASIIENYDFLIENNRRRMALLEDSARLLYREWFVRLRFPGYEHTRIVDGVPEGWNKLPFEEALVLQRGFDLPSQNRNDGTVLIYGSTGINGYHDVAKVIGPGVVTGRSGTLGEVHFVSEDFWPLNTALWVKEFKLLPPLFGLFLMREMDLKQYNGGVSVPTLDRKIVHKVEILIPSKTLVDEFELFANDIFDQIKNLNLQNQKLRTARDLLLPRLMSGEIEV